MKKVDELSALYKMQEATVSNKIEELDDIVNEQKIELEVITKKFVELSNYRGIQHNDTSINTRKTHVRNLTERIKDHECAMYQLVGGLFCNETQAGSLKCAMKDIFGSDYKDVYDLYDEDPDDYTNTSRWDNNPTTLQGNELERRLDKLESRLTCLFDLDK